MDFSTKLLVKNSFFSFGESPIPEHLTRKASVLLLFLLMVGSSILSAQEMRYNDGPYISIKDKYIEVKWVEKGIKKDSILHAAEAGIFDRPGFPKIDLKDLSFEIDTFRRHTNIPKFAALSDVHGQYKIFVEILQAQQIIDQELNWIYGNGHLVIVGDVFDRGDEVLPALWLLFNLEKEAKKEGGKVHLLLGNHELMVLHQDLRYIHDKYVNTSKLFKQPYTSFFDKTTVLGQWLRSKNITTVINEAGFVHGGYSAKVLEKEKALSEINKAFKNQIIDASQKSIDSDELLSLLYFENGPLWYRGYANPAGFDSLQAELILQTLDLERVIVGHTSMPRIVSINDNKIFLVDSSIKFGTTGEILLFQNNSYYRGLISGELVLMTKSRANQQSPSPFEYVLGLGETDLLIELETDVKALLKNSNKEKEEYQDAKLIAVHNGEFNRTWDVRMRASGNVRKQVCKLPPLKIDFSKSTLDYLGFTKNDKLKLILPCNKGKEFQQNLYKEFLIYKLFRELDTLGLKNHLVRVKLINEGQTKYDQVGFFLEDQRDYVDRTGARVIEKGKLNRFSLNRPSYLQMIFFQYMILNTDFGISNKHNLKMIGMPGENVPKVIPYDFDYAGIVNQDYAIPHPKLKIESIRTPLFRGKGINEEEVAEMSKLFLSKADGFIKIINDFKFLDKRNKEGMIKDLKRFFKELEEEKKWKKHFILK